MAVLGFSVHPGPLPFVTIRERDKWAPRLTNGQIEIRGEGPCDMPQQMVRVVKVEAYDGEPPAHVAALYKGKQLIAVHLEELA